MPKQKDRKYDFVLNYYNQINDEKVHAVSQLTAKILNALNGLI